MSACQRGATASRVQRCLLDGGACEASAYQTLWVPISRRRVLGSAIAQLRIRGRSSANTSPWTIMRIWSRLFSATLRAKADTSSEFRSQTLRHLAPLEKRVATYKPFFRNDC